MSEKKRILTACEGTKWMYFASKPRCEVSLFKSLSAQKILCYLPMVKKTTEYSRRVYTRMTPMFPGYVFASVRREDFDIAKVGRYVSRCYFLDDGQSDCLLRDLITVQKYETLAQKHKIQVLVNVDVGESVVITKGYFKGENAIIRRVNANHDEVIVQLMTLPMAISVQLPVDFLSKEE